MFRQSSLLLLLVLLAPFPGAAGDSDRFPPPGRATVVGRVVVDEDEVALRVLEEGIDRFPVLLAEERIEPGGFRLSFPKPGRFFRLVATAGDGLLKAERFRPPNSIYRISELWEPDSPRSLSVHVVKNGGDAVAGARVVLMLGIPGWEESTAISFLTREFTADDKGHVTVPVPAGAHGIFVAYSGVKRSRIHRLQARETGKIWLRLASPTRLNLHLEADHGELPASVPNAGMIDVQAFAGGDWTSVSSEQSSLRNWMGLLPEGATAVRVSCPGRGPVEIRDERMTAEHSVHYSIALLTEPIADLKVLVATPPGHPRVRRPDGARRVGPPPPDPWEAQARPVGGEKWMSAGPIRGGGFGCCVGPPGSRGVEPGRYEVRVRGYLLAPVHREVEVEKGIRTVVRLHPESGGAVQLVVRSRGGRPVETVSFTVLDETGGETDFLYTESRLLGPVRSQDGPLARDFPNGGIVQLPAGRYAIVLDHGSGETSRHDVRVYPGIVTRLEVASDAATRRDGVRVR